MDQQEQFGQGQELVFSPEVYQIAETHRLGTPMAQHKSRLVRPLLFAIVVGGLGVLMMLSLLGGFHLSTIIIFLFGLAFVFYAFSRIRSVVNNRGARVYLCTDGLMRVKSGAAEAIRWDQVREVSKIYMYYGLAQVGVGLRLLPALKEYQLRRADGTELVLAKTFSRFRQLGKTIEKEVTRRGLPSALAACNAGQMLQFGSISVSAQGILLPSKKEPLSWDEVNKVLVSGGILYVNNKKKGALLYSNDSFLVSQIPNFCVLVELVKQIKSASSVFSSPQRTQVGGT